MNLHVKNYKSIINNSFDFSKINILIGENSAGKSSIIKLLLLLKQSMMGYKNRTSFNLALISKTT
jgi:AAA15 family ATPase/GTPase